MIILIIPELNEEIMDTIYDATEHYVMADIVDSMEWMIARHVNLIEDPLRREERLKEIACNIHRKSELLR
jgi:hypothetical protein